MIETDSRSTIGEYVFLTKYSMAKNGKKETFEESVDRVMQMHRDMYADKIAPEHKEIFEKYMTFTTKLYKEKRVLGAQRALQYGGELLLEKPARLYNCTMSHCNRIEFFEEAMYLLLAGCGVGSSVQRRHTEQLPIPIGFTKNTNNEVFQIPDSIEGWAAAIGTLMTNYYLGGVDINFDYSLIRPRGSHIRGGFKAPGAEPLMKAIEKIRGILKSISGRKLKPIELHYITCIFADSVVTGGVRRSAMITLFDADDEEMMTCKTGDWIATKPELCRCNNSVAILPDTPKEVYDQVFDYVKQFGEPGFVFLPDPDYACNPCGEVITYPIYTDENGNDHTGWNFCNLSEINGGAVKTDTDFYAACQAAAFLGTLQAGYTNFQVLSQWSRKIAERDALIGVGITGLCENPDILFNEEIQKRGAEIVKQVNALTAKIIGINPAARCTVVKPSGNSSQLLGCLSGITPGHAHHYIRHIQAADTEQGLKLWKEENPACVEESFWAPDKECVIGFSVTLPQGSVLRKDLTAVQFLELVLKTKNNWIEYGTRFGDERHAQHPKLRMNVSNTCTVKDGEWEEVKEFIWANRDKFSGVSLLSYYGDLEYPQAPFTEVLTETELAEQYGAGAILSSGLIVDAEKVFANIWEACNVAMGNNPKMLEVSNDDIGKFISNNIRDGHFLAELDGIRFSDVNCVIDHLNNKVNIRKDWIRRFNNFADKYMGGDKLKTTYCLKHVNAYHKWQNLCRMKPVDYSKVVWDMEEKEAGSQVASGCMGGQCELSY